MPQYTGGFGVSDWLTIISIIVGLAIQSWAFFKWQSAQFQKRDERLEEETEERHKQIELVKDRTVANRDILNREVARLDRENATTRHELSVALASLPTREYMEAMFASRVQPLEADLRALVIELARSGLPNPKRREE